MIFTEGYANRYLHRACKYDNADTPCETSPVTTKEEVLKILQSRYQTVENFE